MHHVLLVYNDAKKTVQKAILTVGIFLGFAFSEGSTNVGLVANEHVQHNFGDSNAQVLVFTPNIFVYVKLLMWC